MTWRIIDTNLANPYYVTALDEALTISIGKFNGPATLHFYGRDPPGVSVGYFRNVKDDVNLDFCQKNNIKIVRRTSAGGTIYTDRNQLIFSLISKKSLGRNIEEIFKKVCTGIIDTLKVFSINANFKPPNDIIINGKKISGSAQVKKWNAYLIHSTLILGLDNKILENALKNFEPGYTSSIEFECGFQPELQALKNEISNSFTKIFNIEFRKGSLYHYEKEIIQNLLKNKYTTRGWNFKR